MLLTVGYPTFGSYFGPYDGPIFYQNVTCYDPYNCSAANATDPACNSSRVAGVMCVDGKKPHINVKVHHCINHCLRAYTLL